MAELSERGIRQIYECWNAGDLDGVMSAFRSMGPAGFSVEYVGAAPIEGEAAVRDMWDNFAGKCTTDVIELIVNGTEAAALIHNNINDQDKATTMPSIETYRIEDGQLIVRYFHQTAENA